MLKDILRQRKREDNKKFYGTVSLAIILNLIILTFSISNVVIFEHSRQENFDGIEYGDKISREEFLTAVSTPLKLQSEYLLLIFLDPERQSFLRELAYLDLLYQQYRDSNLEIAGIFSNLDTAVVDYYKRRLALTLPLINDTALQLYERFNVKPGGGGLLLIDKMDTVKLVLSRFPNENYVRQIIESQLFGFNRIVFSKKYLDSQINSLPSLDAIRLTHIESNEQRVLREIVADRPTLLTIIDPFCPVDQELLQRIYTLNKISKKFDKSLNVILIFKNSVQFHKIRNLIMVEGFLGDAYTTPEVILTMNEYLAGGPYKKLVTSLLVDSSAVIVYAETLDDDEDAVIRQVTNFVKGDRHDSI